MSPLDLQGLPAEWVAALQEAVVAADAGRITALAEQVQDRMNGLIQTQALALLGMLAASALGKGFFGLAFQASNSRWNLSARVRSAISRRTL